MMLNKLLSLFAIGLLSAPIKLAGTFSTDLTIDNHILTSVNDKTATHIRIYKTDDVTTISEHAFDDCVFTDIMISSTVREVEATFPANVTINYAGALTDINFDIPADVTVNEYAYDEGFINYWNEFIRPNINGNICEVEKDHYLKMRELYRIVEKSNFPTDKETIDSTPDGTGTIKDSIAFLDSHFASSNKSQVKEKEISQSTMITLVLIIASFGMTSIGVFYFLKDKNVIN